MEAAGSVSGSVARRRMFGSFVPGEEEEDDDGSEGNGATGFAGKGSSRMWFRATVP